MTDLDLKNDFVYCLFCGVPSIELHHSVLRSQGGKDDSLVPLCRKCHDRRHDETLAVTRKGHVVTFVDRETGKIIIRRLAPQLSDGPSELVDSARKVQEWLDAIIEGSILRDESDEHLSSLYDELRQIKKRGWMAQASVINTMQSRSSYGDEWAEHVAKALGVKSERTIQRRGQIYRSILTNPECAQASGDLTEEGYYIEAVSTDEPARWLNHAHERKVEDPTYTVAKFRAEIRGNGEEATITGITLYCRSRTSVDERIAEQLERRYGVRVLLEKTPAEVITGAFPRIQSRSVIIPPIGPSDLDERKTLQMKEQDRALPLRHTSHGFLHPDPNCDDVGGIGAS